MRVTGVSMSPEVGASGSEAGELFNGIDAAQLECVRACLGVQSFSFERGEEILACASGREHLGVLRAGVAFDVRRYPSGEDTLVDVIEPGDLLGEGWRSRRWRGGEPPRERAVVGARRGVVILLDASRLSDPAVSCPAKATVQNNLLRSVLYKEERLRMKLEILRHRSLRNRIANYLVVQSQSRGVTQFVLPLSRTELAKYLLVDRAALSRELARMREEGLIDFHRSSFALRRVDELSGLIG